MQSPKRYKILHDIRPLGHTTCEPSQFIMVNVTCSTPTSQQLNSSIFQRLKVCPSERPYLIFVFFFTQSNFLENEIYTEKRHFFALNL